MAELSITHDFVRALAKNIQAACGTDLKHTQVLDLVASALGWKTDALMHRLKNESAPAPSMIGQEAPDDVDDKTLSKWVGLRRWRNIEKDLADYGAVPADYPLRHKPDPLPDAGLAAAASAICRLAFDDRDGALAALGDTKSEHPLFVFMKAIVRLMEDEDDAAALEDFARVVSAVPSLAQLSMWKGMDIGQQPLRGTMIHFWDQATWEHAVMRMLQTMPSPVIGGLVAVTARKMRLEGFPQPAVPIEKSITDDAIICLFDGEARKLMRRHVRATHGIEWESYIAYWGLPRIIRRSRRLIWTRRKRPHSVI